MAKERLNNVDHSLREFKRLADKSAQLKSYPEGQALIYDIKPERALLPPVLFVQGWGVNKARYRKMKAISDAGSRVVAVHPTPLRANLGKPDTKVGIENERKANIYLKTLKELNIKKANAIAVSGGAAPALQATLTMPSQFENMVLVTPVGFNGEVTEWELTKRFIVKEKNTEGMKLRDREVDLSMLQAGVEFALHLASPRRAIREVRDMSRIDTYKLARQAVSQGINISVICARNDTIFPLEEIYQNFEKSKDSYGNTLPIPFFDFQLVEGNHDETSPLSALRIEAAVSLLSRMNA